MKTNYYFLSVALLVLSLTNVFAQNERPKIGLVLSGGGAKGAAHIGVLKAMEEAGLTPDYITGTSMGSIMGGLYSIGYSADELQEIVEGIDWDDILTNKVSWDQVTYEEKNYYGRYLLDFYVKDKKIQFPSGVIEGQALLELFSEVTRPVHNITDFNKFPIPYACVAADIVRGEPVVLNKGSLAMAMRASMAIPTVFTPVKIDGRLLVDGGLVRNVPVQEVIDMGADIVIAVYVGTNLATEEELNSMVNILTQSAFLTSAFDAQEQFKNVDILIKPDLQGYSTASFNNAKEIIQRGMKAGEEYVEIFRNLADSLKKIGPLHEVVKPVMQEKYIFEKIEIEGNKNITDDFIIGKFRFKPGDELTIDEIHEKIGMTYGTQYFEKVTFEILGEPGKRILKVHVVERPNIHLKFSYFYDSENKGGIIANATFRNVILNNSRLIFETNLSAHPVINLDYFKYLGKKQNFAVGLAGLYNVNELPLYDSTGIKTSLYDSEFFAGGVKLQSTSFKNSTFGIEFMWSDISLKAKIVGEGLQITKINYTHTKLGAFYRFNNLNERYFPSKGFAANLELTRSFNADGNVYIGDIKLGKEQLGELLETSPVNSLNIDLFPVVPLGKRLVILSKAKMKLSTIGSSKLNITEYNFVGGFRPDLVNATEYYGAGKKEYYLANFFYGRVGAQYEVKRNIFLEAFLNGVTTEFPVSVLNPNTETGDMDGRNSRFGYGGALGIKSPVGPIQLAVAKDHFQNNWKASLIIGFHY